MSSDHEKASSTPDSTSTPRPTLQAFREHRKRIIRKNWEGREFYNPEDIKRWMRLHSASVGGQSRSNLARLLDEVQTEGSLFRHATEAELTNLPILFAILLDARIQHGHLIHCFKRLITDDSQLMFDEHFDRLRPILMEENDIKGPVQTLLENFKKVRLEYCPIRIGIHKDVHLVDGAILPFCKRLPINQKGGTANVEQYMVQEDLVAEDLCSTLEGSRKTIDGFGECYSIAVKSYNPMETAAYRLEVDAFKALGHIPGVIKFLGEYTRSRTFRGSLSLAHHIVLEFGEHDLDEYLAANFPPILYTETKGFWNSLFEVADTLERLHESQYSGRTLSGWHGDIKPDNILRVNGMFKLADFGFTQFKVRISGVPDPKTHLEGLTRSFGAPEIRTSGQGDGYTQKIDTWSFGCVLSSVATWVILGQQAYDHYPEIRALAIQELKAQKKIDQSVHAPDADDAFHDGVDVLPAVIQWHDLLRNSVRKSDNISGRILDLIEEGMLIGDVQKRFKVKEMHHKLRDVLSLAEDDQQAALESADHRNALKRLSPQMLNALLSLDKDAPASPTMAGEAMSTHLSRQGLGTVREASLTATNQNGRVRKSERLDKNVRAKVAFREHAIMSELRSKGATIPEEGQDDSDQASVPGRMRKFVREGEEKQLGTPSIQITNPVTEPIPYSQAPGGPDPAPSSAYHKQSAQPTMSSVPEQYQSEETPSSVPARENLHRDIKPPPTLAGMSASPRTYRENEKLEKEYKHLSVRSGLKGPSKNQLLEKHIHTGSGEASVAQDVTQRHEILRPASRSPEMEGDSKVDKVETSTAGYSKAEKNKLPEALQKPGMDRKATAQNLATKVAIMFKDFHNKQTGREKPDGDQIPSEADRSKPALPELPKLPREYGGMHTGGSIKHSKHRSSKGGHSSSPRAEVTTLWTCCYCHNSGNSINNVACYNCGVQRCSNCAAYHTTVYPDKVR